MSKARTAANLAFAYAQVGFPDDNPIGWAKHTIATVMMVASNYTAGSHKHVPKDRLNEQLGLPQGAGISGYYRFDDGSYVLLTCDHGLAVWKGGDDVPELVGPIEPARRRK